MQLSPAQREAYARANSSLIHLPAVEFRHPVFSGPLRVVNYDRALFLPLEDYAPVDAGAVVNFEGLSCDIKQPDIDTQVDSTFSIQIDGVSAFVQPLLALANRTSVPVDATIRFYAYNVSTQVVDGPVGVIHLQVRSMSVTKTAVGVTLGYTNTANKAFPSQKYTVESNPGLSA
jgi:hypothetical protein